MPNPIGRIKKDEKKEREEKGSGRAEQTASRRISIWFFSFNNLPADLRDLCSYVDYHYLTREQLLDWRERQPLILDILRSSKIFYEITNKHFNVHQLERLTPKQLGLLKNASLGEASAFAAIMEKLFLHPPLSFTQALSAPDPGSSKKIRKI